jgi:NAD(P)-dependent dehydrogenase (short-subunit alcohol dehydrogenase family)
MQNLEGKVAVVTGASTGIGRSVAVELGRAGMHVVVASQNEARLADAFAEVEQVAPSALAVPTDVGDKESVFALAAATFDRYGGIDVLVNNAGVYRPGYMWEIPLDEWEWVMNVNLWGIVYALHAFVPNMLTRPEGHVVNVSSAGGLMTSTAHGPYTTSKHAVVGLSKGLRREFELKGADIGVTCVCPGMVATAITAQLQNYGPGGGDPRAPELAPEVQAVWDSIDAVVDAGIPSTEVGPMVLDAIRTKRFWLLPNGEQFFPIFERELAELEAGE